MMFCFEIFHVTKLYFSVDLFCIYPEEMEANYKRIVMNKPVVLSLMSSWRPIGTVLVSGKKK